MLPDGCPLALTYLALVFVNVDFADLCLYFVICVKVILTCCDRTYPFTAVVPYPVMYMYIYLPCVAVMLDRWSNSPVTVYRHARNSLLL